MAKVEITETQVYYNDEERNTQPIKEALLREAVKQCEQYSTDLLIFFEYTWKKIIIGEITECKLYFQQMRIDWGENNVPEQYRSKATISRDITKDILSLVIEYGNV